MWQANDILSIFLHQLTEPTVQKCRRIIIIFTELNFIRDKPRTFAHWCNNELTAPSAAQGNGQTCGHVISLCRTNRPLETVIYSNTNRNDVCLCAVDAYKCIAPVSYIRVYGSTTYAVERKILIVFTAVQYLIFSFDFIRHEKTVKKKNVDFV